MKRALAVIALLGLAALVMAARPGTEQQLVQQLNGQPTRLFLPDGGAFGVFTVSDGGSANNTACVSISGLTGAGGVPVTANVFVFVPLQPLNVCLRPSVFSPLWDGGCNVIPSDINYGVPAAAGVPQYLTPDSNASKVCFVGDAGSLQVPVFFAQ